MIWYICPAVAVVLLAVGVKLYFGKEKSVSRMVPVLLCLFAATYIAYIPPFCATFGVFSGVIGDLVNILGIVAVDGDITQFFEVITEGMGNSLLADGYIGLLALLHIILPAASALTAVTVLFRCFSSAQLFFANKRKRPTFVFSEANERSLLLAKSLRDLKCDVVFAGDGVENVSDDIKNDRGFLVKDENIAELAIPGSKEKDVYFFCISEDEDVALSNALQLIEKYTAEPTECQERVHIFLFSRHADFSVFIDSADKGALDVQCINEYETLIYNLLNDHSMLSRATDHVHVLLHGMSQINVVALRAVAWCGQLAGFPLRISVVGTGIGQQISDLQLNCPGLFTDRYDIRVFDCESEKEVVDAICRECKDANYIIVSEETDNLTMERGILLRRLYYKLDPEFKACPPIFCYIKEPVKCNLIRQLTTAEANPARKMNYDLIPFGSLEEVYTYTRLVDSDLEKLAKNVHLAYEEIFSDGAIDVKQALQRYNIFEVNKRSNRANALHIRYKLNMLGLDYTAEPTQEAVRLEDGYTEEMLEKMSRAEHDRWMAFLETEGWIPAQREDVLAYRESGISRGRHNCPILKMHPYICPYEMLKDLSLELEGKDTTVYDRELITRIPDILGDKWHVSGKKYNIVKML